MQILSFPIVPGQQGEAVSNLHDIISWFLEKNQLNISGESDLDQLLSLDQERKLNLYGKATAYFVSKIYSRVGGWDGEPDRINESAAIEIGTFFSTHSDEGLPKVYGRIVNENGVGVPNASLTVFLKTLRAEELAGNGQTDSRGYYEIEIAAVSEPITDNIKRAIQLRASFNSASVASPLIFNIAKATNIDLVMPIANDSAMENEFQVLESKIGEAVGDSELQNLTHQDLEFIKSINESEVLLQAYLYAAEYAQVTGNVISTEVFYGLMRTNGIAPYQAIFNWSEAEIQTLLSRAVSANYISYKAPADIVAISGQIKARAVSLVTDSIAKPPSEAPTVRILNSALSNIQTKDFLIYYNSGNTLDPSFWKDDSLMGAISGASLTTVHNLKRVLGHAINTGNNPALVQYIMGSGLQDIVSQNEDDWKGLLENLSSEEDFIIPDAIKGDNTEDRIKEYAHHLYAIYSNSYKTEYAQAKITDAGSTTFPILKANLDSFVSANPSFDILRTPVAKLTDGTYNPSSYGGEEFIQEISKVQRLNALTNNFDAVEEMAATDIDSAADITRMTQAEFQQAFAAKLGGDAGALDVYEKALSVEMTSQLIAIEAYQVNQVDFPVIYDTSSASTPSDAQLEWRSLFGSVDYCTCEHCLSVFSPAAYFVDCMELLRRFDANTSTQSTTPAYDWLNTKRPDLWDLKLTCKNTNISIPAIDIVNETLETIIDPALALMPSLENLKPGPGNPSVAKETILDARLNRAIPEHINSAGSNTPYHRLLGAAYPWSAPYNYYADQCRSYLKIIDLKPHQIAQAFSAEDHPKTLNTVALACSYLGITNLEISGSPSTVGNDDLTILKDDNTVNLPAYYGLRKIDGSPKSTIVNPANRASTLPIPGNLQTNFLEKVNIFLQQAEISFEDLLELLDCHYVNPAAWIGGVSFRKLRIKGTPETTCDTDKLLITVEPAGGNFSDYSFEQHFLFNAMRIVRLSRKTGLSKYEIDKILTAYGLNYNEPISDGIIIFIAQVLRTKEILKASLEEILPFWGDFPHKIYNSYNGDRPQQALTFYERLFRNQSVVPDYKKIVDYPFKDLPFYDQWQNPPTTILYEQMKSWVLAIFKLANKDLEYLINIFYNDEGLFNPTTDFINGDKHFIFSHENILHLYREIILARFLDLPIEKWVAYRRWIFRHNTDKEPFSATSSSDAALLLRFIEKIKVFEQQTLPFDVMRYAFWDGFNDLQEKELKRKLLIGQLSGLRDILSRVHLDYRDTYENTEVISSEKLHDLLLSLVDPQDADFVVNGIALMTISPLPTPTFSQKEIDYFEALLPTTLSSVEKKTLFGDLSDPPSTDKQERLQVLVDIFLPTLKEKANRKELVSYLSAQNNISAEFTDLLLSNHITSGAEKGLQILMSEPFVTSEEPITFTSLTKPGTPGYPKFSKPFEVIEKLHKISLVLSSLNLSIAEFDVFKPYCDLLIGSVSTNFLSNPKVGSLLNGTIEEWPQNLDATYRFVEWMQLRNAFMPTPLGLHYVLYETTKAPSLEKKEAWVSALSKSLQIGVSEIEVLVGDKTNNAHFGVLNFDFNAGLPQPFQYRKILAAFDMMNWLEAGASMGVQTATAVLKPTEQSDADKVIQIVRARYGNTEWLDIVQPVSDILRVNRRDAMVALLLAYPPAEYEKRWISELDLFETLLIDTQVMPVVQISRIRQGISSLQLYFDRCILQREITLPVGSTPASVVVMGGDAIRQWNMWRKWYRVWEANRKVFVYPENWIEPELRDDKSPFFKELEKFVNQNDITFETMEDAYKNYLERLDEVAFLDIIGYYVEEVKAQSGGLQDSIIHTFGRTRSYPHIYYYRKRVNRVWNAWEKMEAQIEGDHFVPVMWRGRLRLYWVTFMEKIIPEPMKLKLDEEQRPPKLKFELLLHWTEYKNGKWSPSQLGNQNAVLDFGGEAAGPTLAVDLKYHIARWMDSNPADWAHKGLAHTQKSYEREVARMKERMLVYAVKDGEGQLYIECATYMEGLTYKQYRTFLYNKYKEAIYPSSNVPELDYILSHYNITAEDAWFGDQYAPPNTVRPAGYFNVRQGGKYTYVNDPAIVEALVWDTEWFTRRLDSFYQSDNSAPLTRIGRRPGFAIKHHKVEIQEWAYTQYNDYIDNPNAAFEQKNNIYIYPRSRNEGAGYNQVVEIAPSTASTPGAVRVLKLLGKAPDFASAPVKEKYFILQKQYPDSFKPAKISKFFYQDYRNLFFVEKDGQEDVIAISLTDEPLLKGVQIDFNSILIPDRGFAEKELNGFNERGLDITQEVPSYRFYSFYHYRINNLLEQLSKSGLKGLFNWTFIKSSQEDQMAFQVTYDPTGAVIHYDRDRTLYPEDTLDFWMDAPTAIYNWELFFHIPMFIANKLMQEQRFAEAMDWYHLVFNPTNEADPDHGGGTSARFWQFYPFFEHAMAGIPSIQDIMDNSNLSIAVGEWARDPFKPHLIARNRIGAYMRNVVMKYLDNLVAWGDNLFRRDTMESINEATLLYVLAAQILGRRPVKIPARLSAAPMDYQDLLDNGKMNAFSNALVKVQTYLASTTRPIPNEVKLQMNYFCIPPNEKLLAYWDVVADRLHKIRNSQNIDGVERQLALFEPPIDPAMLVRAAAAGVSIADAVAELYAPLPAYRFPTMVQKATELAQEVKSLGSALLAAIEKRDAEQLALLRSVQEQKVLEAAKEARTLQIQEAQAQVAGLNEQKELINDRIGHYQRLVDKGLNREEQLQLDSLQQSIPLKEAQGVLSTLASVFFAFPRIHIQAVSSGVSSGGSDIGNLVNAGATAIGIEATVNDIKGSMAGIKASYARRREEWDMQLKLANREIKQIEKQIIAAEIRQAIAEKELRVQEIQLRNARDLDDAMHDKYSNEDLYNWMISEISYTYFQSYKLAFDIARKAERCYRYELGVEPVKDFIQFGYWNSLKKGLLAADNLLFDVKRLEMSYLEQNVRYHELSKSISLAATDPVALLNLRANGGANIALPEWLFDMDYPGHYFRRIKSISISIPCVAGPYTTVAAKLTLISSKYRKNALPGSTYAEVDSDSRFNYLFNGGQSIATSTAQNDSGLFELNFRDERYLPFEGCGAISNWKLDLPSAFASYDRNTITDVIIHVNYTARYDGGLAGGATAYLNDLMSDNNTGANPKGVPPYHLLSLKHEFSTEWYAAFQTTVPVPDSSPTNDKGRPLAVSLRKSHFPIGVQGKDLAITGIRVISRKKVQTPPGGTPPPTFKFNVNGALDETLSDTVSNTNPVSTFSGMVKDNQPQLLTIVLYKSDGTPMAETDLDDLYLLIEYKIS